MEPLRAVDAHNGGEGKVQNGSLGGGGGVVRKNLKNYQNVFWG
jgi:hypothetical protein